MNENRLTKKEIKDLLDERNNLLGVLGDIETILMTGGSITPKSLIRASILIALGENINEKM
jgi:hypothetical protein